MINKNSYKLWTDSKEAVPTIYLHSFRGEGEEVWNAAHKMGCPPFNLVSIHNIDLDAALTPWSADGIWKGQAPYRGEGEKHLDFILNELISEVNRQLVVASHKDFLAGYSLAGLFSLWAATRSNHFDRLACVSASFWYPGFLEYFQKHSYDFHPQRVYLSLGNKESQTRNLLMSNVGNITQEIFELIKGKGISVRFDMNPGNHFSEPDKRMGKAIKWLLQEEKEHTP